MPACNDRKIVEQMKDILPAPRVEAVAERGESRYAYHGKTVRLRIGRDSANAKLACEILSFAPRCHGGEEPIEAESPLIHHPRRKSMGVTQHSTAIVDHLRKELV